MTPGFGFLIMLALAAFFYKAADFEDLSGIAWGGASVAMYLLMAYGLHWGLMGLILGQLLVLVGMGLWIYWRE